MKFSVKGKQQSGVDLAIFRKQVAQESGQPAVLAYDLQERPASGELSPALIGGKGQVAEKGAAD